MSLKTQVLRGGTYLALRQGLGVALSLGGVLFLTRVIGPEKYGLYAAALGVFLYLQNLSQLGIEVYLVRREGEERLAVYHQAFTLLLCLSLGATLLSQLGTPLLQRWIGLEGFGAIARVMFLSLPLLLLLQIPRSQLERNLDYKRVALIELFGQLAFYLTALPLAFQGAGVWAPVAGWWVQQVQTVGLFYWSVSYRPRLHWEKSLIKQMIGYSLGFSASLWIWQLRTLINPLLVGRYGGADAVGYVALAIRMVETLSFVLSATWRISIATLARLQGDRARLVKAVTEGMGLQILALGPLLVVASWLAPVLLPVLFGDRWLPVINVYPFIALGYLSNALFNMHSSTLYVLQRNWEVTSFHAIHIVLFAGTAFLLLPRMGLIGYGWAEVAALASYTAIHFYLVRNIGHPDYRLPGLWWGACAIALFAPQIGWWATFGIIGVALLPATQAKIKEYAVSLKGVKNPASSLS